MHHTFDRAMQAASAKLRSPIALQAETLGMLRPDRRRSTIGCDPTRCQPPPKVSVQPTHVDGGAGNQLAGCQRCGKSLSMSLAGCVGNRFSTSLM